MISSGFHIAHVHIPNRLVLAPMAGVTDVIFRALCKKEGAGLMFTEMASDQGLCYANRQSHSITEITPSERPVAIQIFGSRAEFMARAAAIVAQERPDFIDVNMGCPVPKVVKNNEGCALMLEPERAMTIIRAVREASGLPITAKFRKGWDHDRVNAVEFALACQEAGVAAITVHGRTRSQFYSGKADWGIIGLVKQSVRVPVIGNGDIWEPEDAIRMLSETGCDGAMVGRGSLGNPWIFSRALRLMNGQAAPTPSYQERIDMALLHLRLTIEKRGEKSGIPYMRKHLAWYMKGLPGAARARDLINIAKNTEDVADVLQRFETSLREDKPWTCS